VKDAVSHSRPGSERRFEIRIAVEPAGEPRSDAPEAPQTSKRSGGDVRVLGLGNVLMGDDALGPWVIEELLARYEFPNSVSVLDVGTPGLDLTPYLADAEKIFLVDTVKAQAPPGSLRVYSREEILARPAEPRLSPHDPGLAEALMFLSLAGSAPKNVELVGVVPERVEKGIGLSAAVRRAVAPAAAEIVERLSALGLAPRRPDPSRQASPWWEAPAEAV
jgi:hydrogenase maturation protease